MPWTYQRGKRYWRQFHPTPFLFDSEFMTVQGAPFPDPFICTPGPGSWRVTDPNLRMTSAAGFGGSGGALVYAAAGGSPQWDTCMLQGTIPSFRTPGRFIEFQITPTNVAYHKAGWNNAASASQAYTEATIYVGGGGFVNVTDGLDVASPLYPYLANTQYQFRIYDTGTGFLYYAKKQFDPPNTWVLLWERASSVTHLTTLYPALNNLSMSGYMGFIRVRQGLAKPPVSFSALPPINYPINTGVADGLFEASIKAPVSDQRSLYFRIGDPNNYWRVLMDTTAGTYSLQKCVAGAITTVGTQTYAWLPGAFYLIRVFAWTNLIRAFIGVTSGPITTDPFNQTATSFGTGPISGGSPVNTGDIINLKCQTGGAMRLN